jgi:RNA polymerase sigma factor for flagellar operon FliA
MRRRLVLGNLDYVRGMAGQMRRSLPAAIEIDDLVAYGAIGLCESAARFDRRSGARFSTYSHLRIRGAILDGVRLMGWFGAALDDDEDVAAQPAPMSAAEFELAAAVRQAVAALPYEARRLIELHYFEDQSLEDCGRVLGISKSWASRLRSRALAMLSERLRATSNTSPDRSGNA